LRRQKLSPVKIMGSIFSPSKRLDSRTGALLVLGGAAMISFSGVYVKLALVTPTVSAFYRVVFGGIILTGIALCRGQRLWRSHRHLILSILCGLFFALDLILWHTSIHYIGPGLATILANFQVFCLALVGFLLFGETLRFRLVLAIPLAVGGLFLIVGIDWKLLGPLYRMGIILGLAAALCYTGYTLLLRELLALPDALAPAVNLAVVCATTALLLAGLALLRDETLVIPDVQSAMSLIAYGLFSQALGWMVITAGLPRIEASLTGLLLLLQPALAFGWDMLWFDRQTTTAALGGVAVTLLAIYMGSTGTSATGVKARTATEPEKSRPADSKTSNGEPHHGK
jgi:drug/metabolite transporter (DMT)-like permease